MALLLWRFPIISLNFPLFVNNFKGSHLIWVRKTWFDSLAMEGCHLLCKNEFLDQDDWWITGHAQWVPMHSAYPRMHSKCSIELNLLFLVWLKKSQVLFMYIPNGNWEIPLGMPSGSSNAHKILTFYEKWQFVKK